MRAIYFRTAKHVFSHLRCPTIAIRDACAEDLRAHSKCTALNVRELFPSLCGTIRPLDSPYMSCRSLYFTHSLASPLPKLDIARLCQPCTTMQGMELPSSCKPVCDPECHLSETSLILHWLLVSPSNPMQRCIAVYSTKKPWGDNAS